MIANPRVLATAVFTEPMTHVPHGRAVGNALPGIVASLGAWGVVEGHWLPDKSSPVVFLTTRTEIQRVVLEAAPWLSSQVSLLLARAQVSYGAQQSIRMFIESEEAHQSLGDSLGEDETS